MSTPAAVAPLAAGQPDEPVSPAPAESRGLARDGVRLMVATGRGLVHARFHDLPAYLHPGDLVVVNNSATIAAELDGRWRGGPVVVHVATRLDEGTWVVELRTAPAASKPVLDAAVGDRVTLAGSTQLLLLEPRAARPRARSGVRLWRVAVEGDRPLTQQLLRHGRPISYGYLDRRYPLSAYQTVFAHRPGSAEMPSAGRPFTPDLVTRLVARGVLLATVTLHTGVSSQEAGEPPLAERFAVPAATARLVDVTRRGGGRVVAVGTTVTRALESVVLEDGTLTSRSGWTDRVLSPDAPPRVVDGLLTGWHEAGASHLQLVESVAGPTLMRRAYEAARTGEYLWHEFGDTVLFLPR